MMAEKIKKGLNPQQELFCQYFASDREFFGNGVQSYIEAYDVNVTHKGAYNAARVSAHRLLTNANILKRIDTLFEASGLNDTFVDKQIEKLIIQDADFSTKLSAIREYNALRNRITKNIRATVELPTPILGGISVDNIKNDIKQVT
jgi:terminase small subunit-like protein